MNTADLLAPIDERLTRCQEDFDNAIREVAGSFVEYETHRFVYECDAQTREHRLRIEVYRTPNLLRAGILIGEFVHQARATLDNLVGQLSIKGGGGPVWGSAFPVFRKSKKYFRTIKTPGPDFGKPCPSSGIYKIRGTPQAAWADFDALQPYQGMADMNGFGQAQQTDARIRRSLLILEEFWNMDKHRVPAVVVAPIFTPSIGIRATGFGTVTQEEVARRINFHAPQKVPVKDGAVLLRFTPPPGTQVDVDLDIAIFVLFDNTEPGWDQPIRSTLQNCLDDVRAVVNRFRGHFV